MVQNSVSGYEYDSMHILAPPPGSETRYIVGLQNSAYAPPSGSKSNGSHYEDRILDVSESSSYGSYLSVSEMLSGDDGGDYLYSIVNDRDKTNNNGGSDMACIIYVINKIPAWEASIRS